MAASLGIPVRSLRRGARSGRIALGDLRKLGDGTFVFHKKRVNDTWYLAIDPKHVKTPKGGKTADEITALQEAAAAASPLPASRASLDLTGTSDKVLSELRERLSAMTATQVRIAADTTKVLKAEIELAQSQNDLVRREDVYTELYTFGKMIRNRLEGVPVRVVDGVMAATDRVEVIRLITEEIDAALTALTRLPDITNT
jgi:hypothetical protein